MNIRVKNRNNVNPNNLVAEERNERHNTYVGCEVFNRHKLRFREIYRVNGEDVLVWELYGETGLMYVLQITVDDNQPVCAVMTTPDGFMSVALDPDAALMCIIHYKLEEGRESTC